MKRIMVRYRVKPDQAERNRELVRAVYDELAELGPSGMSYGTFELEDGVSFVHIHASEPEDENTLPTLAAFREFVREIDARCDEAPVVTELREVRSYRLFGA